MTETGLVGGPVGISFQIGGGRGRERCQEVCAEEVGFSVD